MSSFIGMDMVIAFGLIGIAIVTYLIYRLRILPNRHLPFVAAALAGIFGIAILKKMRQAKLSEELKKLEEAAERQTDKARDLKETAEAEEQVASEYRAKLERRRDALKEEMLLIEAEHRRERERINNMTKTEKMERFDKVFGSD